MSSIAEQELLTAIEAFDTYIHQYLTRELKITDALGNAGVKKLKNIFEKAEVLKACSE